jgi:hypothetical protein
MSAWKKDPRKTPHSSSNMAGRHQMALHRKLVGLTTTKNSVPFLVNKYSNTIIQALSRFPLSTQPQAFNHHQRNRPVPALGFCRLWPAEIDNFPAPHWQPRHPNTQIASGQLS